MVPPRVNTLWREGAKPWIGKPCTVLTATAVIMGSPLRKDIWSRTVPAVGSREHGVKCKACEGSVVLRYGTVMWEGQPASSFCGDSAAWIGCQAAHPPPSYRLLRCNGKMWALAWPDPDAMLSRPSHLPGTTPTSLQRIGPRLRTERTSLVRSVTSALSPRPLDADPRTLWRGAQSKRTMRAILRSLDTCSGHPLFTKSLCSPAQS
jgi:hypothetical protein